MEKLSIFYPLTLILQIFLISLWSYLKEKGKGNNGLFGMLALIMGAIYLISFFTNYSLTSFLAIWFLRDFVILFLISKVLKAFFEYKVLSTAVFIIAMLVGGAHLFISNGLLDGGKSEYDDSAELLFDIKDKDKLDEIKELLKAYNPEILEAFSHVEDEDITELDDFYTIDVEDVSKVQQIKAQLEQSGLTDWVEFNETYSLSPIEKLAANDRGQFSSNVLNDPFIDKLWGFGYMDIDNLSSKLDEMKPVKKAKIFILDTGVDAGHEDLEDNYHSISKEYDTDTDIHGTHCAGIACAVSNNKKGIASLNLNSDYTSITSITVLPGGYGTQESIIDGMITAADKGADVISMSLGGFSSDARQRAYNQAIEYANKKGAIVVVAAGNENTNAKRYVPANCKGVITVAAVDNNLEKASFSNIVRDIEYKVAAPGVDIYSTTPSNTYKSLNGTSMATPYVAGLVGIMKAMSPNITTKEVYEILEATGKQTKNNRQTGKFIQPLQALQSVKYEGESGGFFKKLITFKPE